MLLVLPLLGYVPFRMRLHFDASVDNNSGMDGIWLATVVLFVAWTALVVLVIIRMARRRYLHGKFVSTHNVLHTRDIDTLRERAEQGKR
jgi:hypothetical protein